MPGIPYLQKPATDDEDVIPFHREGQRLNGIQEMKKGDYYVMVGRSSGIQVGRCNGTLSSQHWRTGEVRYDEDGNAVSRITEEIVVLGQEVRYDKVMQSPFCHSRDLGAFLINSDGFVCGLLYGYLDTMVQATGYTRAGLVTCMSDVRSSAQALTAPRNAWGEREDNHVEIDLPFP